MAFKALERLMAIASKSIGLKVLLEISIRTSVFNQKRLISYSKVFARLIWILVIESFKLWA
jgi:hypothetical protein